MHVVEQISLIFLSSLKMYSMKEISNIFCFHAVCKHHSELDASEDAGQQQGAEQWLLLKYKTGSYGTYHHAVTLRSAYREGIKRQQCVWVV